MRTILVNRDPALIKKVEEVNHHKRGLEKRCTILLKGVDEDGDAFIYKIKASADLSLALKEGQEIPPFHLVVKFYPYEGEKYYRILECLPVEDKNASKKVN